MADPVEVACPHCRSRMLVHPDMFGGPVRCVECLDIFRADESTRAAVRSEWAEDLDFARYDVAPDDIPMAPAVGPAAASPSAGEDSPDAAPYKLAPPDGPPPSARAAAGMPAAWEEEAGRLDVEEAAAPPRWQCPNCGARVGMDLAECPICGTMPDGRRGTLAGIDFDFEARLRERVEKSVAALRTTHALAGALAVAFVVAAAACFVLMLTRDYAAGFLGLLASGASAYAFRRAAEHWSDFSLALLACFAAWLGALFLYGVFHFIGMFG